ncbi:MAG TPA: JAB domain-containing protein [Puia sp.]|jgi:DNA repair protein RadC|nr:JAB domain-containing protein [Puia sp.]
MENSMNQKDWTEIAEVELVYKSNVKASLRPILTSSKDVYELLLQTWDKNKIELQEQFKVLLLNRASRIVGIFEVSSGGVAGTVADPKLIFMAALKSNACNIILAHNHPSGNLKPSKADEELTQKIKMGGKLLEINVLDHLIITVDGYYSFGDESLI